MDFSSPATNYDNNAVMLSTSVDGMMCLWDRRDPTSIPRKFLPPEKVPPWCLSACWSADGKRIYCGRRNGTGRLSIRLLLGVHWAFKEHTFELTTFFFGINIVDEWDFADGRLIQSIKMPANSGPVSFVKSLPNNKHIIW